MHGRSMQVWHLWFSCGWKAQGTAYSTCGQFLSVVCTRLALLDHGAHWSYTVIGSTFLPGSNWAPSIKHSELLSASCLKKKGKLWKLIVGTMLTNFCSEIHFCFLCKISLDTIVPVPFIRLSSIHVAAEMVVECFWSALDLDRTFGASMSNCKDWQCWLCAFSIVPALQSKLRPKA